MTNILIVGRRGLGKSTLAQKVAENINSNQIYFDPSDQFLSVTNHANDLERFISMLENVPKDESYSIAYNPPRGNVEEHWDDFAARLWEFTGRHEDAASFALVVDESHRLQSPQVINDWLDEYIRRSPRRERNDFNPIDLIQTTHYPQDLHRVSWGESDEIYFFNVFDRRAMRILDEQYGVKSPEVTHIVSNLKTPKTGGREILRVEQETGATELIDDERSWFIDIKTPPPEPERPPAKAMKSLREMFNDL